MIKDVPPNNLAIHMYNFTYPYMHIIVHNVLIDPIHNDLICEIHEIPHFMKCWSKFSKYVKTCLLKGQMCSWAETFPKCTRLDRVK